MLWGMVIVCAFLNMKLSNPNDKRPLWEFKHSIINSQKDAASKLGLRKRKFAEINEEERARRPKRNPHKCTLGTKAGRDRRLLVAMVCERTSGGRMVNLGEYFKKPDKCLRCARCGSSTRMACLGCGVALCIKPFKTARNRRPVSCMDICHIRWKYDLETGALRK